MAFFDWWGFVGTGIQSAFAWMTFNRDAFADNVSMRQNQKYQQKNYQISWVAIARDDIRDMMGISVNRINNYMIVATLILSVAAGTVIGVSFDERCPAFIVNAFYLCMGTSLTYLLLAIMFGVSGQNSAFTNTMKLLTYQVRPENPAEYSHEYMRQAQWVEQNGVRSLFRIPGLQANYRTQGKDGAKVAPGIARQPTEEVNLEDDTPLESLVVRTTHTWYLTKFAQFMRLWHPYDTSSKYAMGLGIISLCQGTAYFSLGTLISHTHLDDFSALVMTSVFVFMALLSTMQHLHNKTLVFRCAVFLLVGSGPLLGAIGSVTEYDGVRQVAVPLCFLCHALFWLFALLLTLDSSTLKNESFLGGQGGFWANDEDGGSTEVVAESGVATESGCDLGRIGNKARRRRDPWPPEQPVVPRGLQQDDIEVSVGRSGECPDAAFPEGCCGPSCMLGGPGGTRGAADAGADARKRAEARDYIWGGERTPRLGAADSHCPDHWPTDDAEFEEKASGTKMHISHLVTLTLLVSEALWLLLSGWAIGNFWFNPKTLQARPRMGFNTTSLEPVNVQWPGPLFHPESLACADGRIFAADRFRVFELSAERPARPVACGLRRPIASIAAGCDVAHGCRPLVLLAAGGPAAERGAPSEVADCALAGSNESSWPLLQDDVPAELLAVSAPDWRLITARQGVLVQYLWSPEARAWAPEWSLGSASGPEQTAGAEAKEALVALAAAPGRLLALRDARPARPHVDVRSASTLEVLARWRLPKEALPIAGGCAWAGQSALVLRRSAAGEPPRLFRAGLP